MASGKSQPWTGTPQDLAGGLGMLLADLCRLMAFSHTPTDAHFQVLLWHQRFPRTQGALCPEMSVVTLKLGSCLSDVPSLAPKGEDRVGDMSSTGDVPWCPGPTQRGVSTNCCHSQTPQFLPTGLCYGLLGLGPDSHLLCAATQTRAVGW